MVKEELMENWQQRTELLLGAEKMERLRKSHVLVVGLGGVGAYAAEMICRAGVGRMTIVDADIVQPTNINRQLPATHATLGMEKAKVLEARFRDINPEIELTVLPVYLKDDNIPELLDAARYDFIVDAIDTISPKLKYGCATRIVIVMPVWYLLPCIRSIYRRWLWNGWIRL